MRAQCDVDICDVPRTRNFTSVNGRLTRLASEANPCRASLPAFEALREERAASGSTLLDAVICSCFHSTKDRVPLVLARM